MDFVSPKIPFPFTPLSLNVIVTSITCIDSNTHPSYRCKQIEMTSLANKHIFSKLKFIFLGWCKS